MSDTTTDNRTGENTDEGQRSSEILGLKASIVSLVLLLGGLLLIVGAALISADLPSVEGEKSVGLGMLEVISHIIRDLGIAALVSGLLGAAYDQYLRKQFIESASSALSKIFLRNSQDLVKEFNSMSVESFEHVLKDHDNEVKQLHNEVKQLQQLREAGVSCVYENRDEVNLGARFQHARKTIQILETWTGYRDFIDGWIKKAIVEHNCKVQILLLNPTSDQVTYRNEDLGYRRGYVRNEIEQDLDKLEGTRRELPQNHDPKDGKGQLEIKVYDATPVMHMYRFDDTWIMGTYFNEDSIKTPQFEVKKPSHKPTNAENSAGSKLDFAQRLENHFEHLWTHKKTKPLSEIVDCEATKQGQELASIDTESSSSER